ncbi:uncharacterized protein [Solanum lycopersicum]|uniref:uncharacterized protein n=1 Tax=Solanum lycopersicum TaxID=4081 RepID=UPI003747D5EF
MSSSWDRFTAFVRGVPNHCTDDESLKEYFYRGQDDNNKAVLDTIAGDSFGECTYTEITEKLAHMRTEQLKNKEDSGAFTIPCTIGLLHFAKALCDLGAIINLMPLSFYKKLGLGDPKPIAMRLLMADQKVKRPVGVHHDVLMKVESFIFPSDFVNLDCEVDFEVTIILGRPFLETCHALVYMEKRKMKFRLNNEDATFNICTSMKRSGELQTALRH